MWRRPTGSKEACPNAAGPGYRFSCDFRDLAKQDLTYEELSAAYRSRTTGAHWYHLASGHLIAESGIATRELPHIERDFDLVYERRGAKSELHSLPC